jgi:hypothetical protein
MRTKANAPPGEREVRPMPPRPRATAVHPTAVHPTAVHPTAVPRGPALLLALQSTAGNAAVQRMVRLADPPRAARVLPQRERRAFVDAELTARRDRADGRRVIEDMAGTSDVLDFSSRSELRAELIKRVTMTQVMQDSQAGSGRLAPFGYPFTGASRYWGPRVGYAARDYWVPPTPDDYDLRRDPVKRADLRNRPRRERHLVFGDQGASYRFDLSPRGVADPWQAIMTLFSPQAPHKRTLVHCDYLVSLVHFRAFMATLGKAAFNARIAAYGAGNIQLRYDLFSELEPRVAASAGSRPGLNSIRQVVPASPRDLVIGDHVYFYNHPAYDVINRRIGNAWRLENAVLVLRSGGNDVFLGHGSGRKTAAQMKAKLAEEYNDVASEALRLVQRTRRGSASSRAAARAELTTRFPGVVEVGGRWRVQGTGMRRVAVDIPLALLRPSQIPGLFDPANPGVMYPVRRAVESA